MSRVVIVASEKGGVGKTFFATHAIRFLNLHGHKLKPIDFDCADDTLSRIFPIPLSASISPSILDIENGVTGLYQLFTKAQEGNSYFIDSGANSGDSWSSFFLKAWPTLQDELKANGVKLTIVCPVTGTSEKSKDSFLKYRNLFPTATVILVTFSKMDAIYSYPEHPIDLTISLPTCPQRLFDLYEDTPMLIDDIAVSLDPKIQSMRGPAKAYLPKLHSQFSKILPHLIP